MKARYLLDTNIVIYLRQKRPQPVLDRFRTIKQGEAVISIITYGELLYGANKSSYRIRALAQLEELVQILPVMQLAEATAASYGAMRADLEKRGQVISNNDLWIAAHAHAAGLTLITNNEKEFKRVPDLRIENWVRPV